MIEIESTTQENEQVSYCVVYEKNSGRIVSKHGFIGDGTGLFGPDGKDERSRTALDVAQRHHPAKKLLVMHPPLDFRFEPTMLYRVDVKSGKLAATKLIERKKKKR